MFKRTSLPQRRNALWMKSCSLLCLVFVCYSQSVNQVLRFVSEPSSSFYLLLGLGMSDEDSRASSSSSSSSSSNRQQETNYLKKKDSKASMSKSSKLLSTSAKRSVLSFILYSSLNGRSPWSWIFSYLGKSRTSPRDRFSMFEMLIIILFICLQNIVLISLSVSVLT